MTTDNKIIEFTRDDQRQVFSVPTRLVVECTVFILAKDMEQAKRLLQDYDINDCFSFDRDSVTTDGEGLLRVDDVHTFPIDVSVVDIRAVDVRDYPPNEHPDFVGFARR